MDLKRLGGLWRNAQPPWFGWEGADNTPPRKVLGPKGETSVPRTAIKEAAQKSVTKRTKK